MYFLEKAAYCIIAAFFRFIGMIPRPWAVEAGSFIGRLWFSIDRHHREITLDNLSRAYQGEKDMAEIRQLALRTFENIGQIFFEMGWSLGLSPEDFHKHFRIKGLDRFADACKKGKGVIL